MTVCAVSVPAFDAQDVETVEEENCISSSYVVMNIALIWMNAADGIPERFSDIADWYIGGHSLGGAMAASYGAQKGDGTPTISVEEQQQQTADALAAWMKQGF